MREEWKETEMPKAENETLSHDLCPSDIFCEAAGDYTLPDYQPEIRKILHIRTAVLPAGRYTSGGKMEFTGTVSHTVLYADAEGKLASTTLDADYDFALPLPREEGRYTVLSDTLAEGTTCRPGGPRKLSLRTKLRTRFSLYEEEGIAPLLRGMGSEEDRACLESSCTRTETVQMAYGMGEALPLSCEMRLDTPGEGDEVMYAGGHMHITECRATEGGCTCRGQAWVKCVLRPAEGLPYTLREKIPFEQFIPLDDMGEKAMPVAHGRMTVSDAAILPGVGDEAGSLRLTCQGEIEVTAPATRVLNPIRDMYSTAYDMALSYRTARTTRPVGAVCGNYTVSGSCPRAACDAEAAGVVIDTDGRVEIDSVTVERGRALVCGRVLCNTLLAASADGGMALSSADTTIPFRVESELRPPEGCSLRFFCRAELLSARTRLEVSSLSTDAEVALSLTAYTDEEVSLLAEGEPDHSLPVEHRGNRIFVVYPAEDDSLFSIGRRYHKSRAAIAEKNDLGEGALAVSHLPSSLDGMHHLLIED